MKSGAITADEYPGRAMMKPKIEPVPVVRMIRHTKASTPTGAETFCQRRSRVITA